jgi:RNA polymerase sigma-70 factor (ECF subfamily)
MKRLMANEWDQQTALKRGGGKIPISLDFESADRHYRSLAGSSVGADKLFMQDWVRTLLDRVFQRLESEYESAGKCREFQRLKSFITAGELQSSMSEVAKELGSSAGAVRVAVHRLRRRYRKFLREEVLQTVQNPDEVEDEIRSLFAAFD